MRSGGGSLGWIRTTPLAPFAEKILAVQRRLHPASELVFPDMPKRQVIDRQMKRIREAAGIQENVTFYCFPVTPVLRG